MTGALAKYDAARAALAAAKSVDEVLGVRDEAERLKLYARQAKDRGLLADAMEIQMRAERRLGEMIRAAKEAGQIARGRFYDKPNSQEDGELERLRLADVGIDHNLSSKAQRLAEVSEEQFDTTIARARDKIASGSAIVVDPMKDLTTAEKQQKRANREALLGAYQQSFAKKRYGVIYADPAWRFEPRSRVTGMDRAPENHYPTMTLDDICALPVGDIAAADCALFLWVTIPFLIEGGGRVIAAWGFDYVSNYVWGKDKAGPGYWARERHEHLLVATRGGIPCPAQGTQWDSLQMAPRKGHSAKPELFLEMIEAYYPSLPKIELNRRGPARPGWDAWGNEAVAGEAERSQSTQAEAA